MEFMNNEEQNDMFVELAKAKNGPASEDEPARLSISEDEVDSKELASETEGQLTVDVYRDGDDIVVESTVAGVDPDNLEVNITTDAVTIRGKRGRETEVKEKDFFYQECFWGRFSRTVILPDEVNPEESEATLTNNGVLRVRMPRLKKNKAKKLKVKVN